MFLGCSDEVSRPFVVGGCTIQLSSSVLLLGVTIDHKLTFSSHIQNICSQANRKTNALLRIRRYVDKDRAHLLCNAYILSCFKYCPLIWMFHSKGDAKRIQSTQIRAIRAETSDFATSSDDILSAYNIEPIHTTNLRFMLVEVFKSINRLNPDFLWDLFLQKNLAMSLRGGKSLKVA